MRNEDQLNKKVSSAREDMPRNPEEEEYAFIRETHKRRPLSARSIFNAVCVLVASGLVFGAAAGVVFNGITGVSVQKTPSTVTIPSDEAAPDKPAQAEAQKDQGAGEGTSAKSSSPQGADKVKSPTALPTKTEGQKAGNGDGSAGESGDRSGADSGESGNKPSTEPTGKTKGTEEGGDKSDASESSASDTNQKEKDTEKAVTSVTPTPVLTEEERYAAVLENYKEVQAAFAGVARQTMDSIVTVTGYTSEEDWFNSINLNSKTISGVIIADNSVDLLVLVEYRAIENTDRIVVTFVDGSLAVATLQMADPSTGFAVIRVPLKNISKETMDVIEPAALGNSFKVKQGDVVIAVGNPGGQTGAFLFGVVTSKSDVVAVEDACYELLSTDMYGSGKGSGVLLNSDGEVIGLLSETCSGEDAAVLDAVPISLVKSLIEHLSNKTPLARTGIYGMDISTGTAQLYDLPAGIYVTALSEESPAFEAGIRVADIITMVDGKAITSMRAYHEKLMELEPGMTMKVTVERSGSEGMVEYTYTVTVGELA